MGGTYNANATFTRTGSGNILLFNYVRDAGEIEECKNVEVINLIKAYAVERI